MKSLFSANFLIVAVPLYLLLSVLGQDSRHKEIYPFFNWSLFSKIPGEIANPTIEVLTAEAGATDVPTDIVEAPGYIRGNSISLVSAIYKLSGARWRDPIDALDIRMRIENSLLSPQVRSYRLITQRYQPARRYLSGEVLEKNILATYDRSMDGDFRLRRYGTPNKNGLDIGNSGPIRFGVIDDYADNNYHILKGYVYDERSLQTADSLKVWWGQQQPLDHMSGTILQDAAGLLGDPQLRKTGFSLVFDSRPATDTLRIDAYFGAVAYTHQHLLQ